MMAKKNDRPQIDERIHGMMDRDNRADMGKPSKVTRARRAPKLPPQAEANPQNDVARQLAMGGRASVPWLSKDLHARDKKGNPIPTLADRARASGAAAYYRPGKARVKKAAAKKAKARTNLAKADPAKGGR